MHLPSRRLFLTTAASAVAAYTQEPQATFRSDTRLVPLYATVVNSKGQLVTDLPRTAFKVLENNVEQPIKAFLREDVPVSLGLIVDNSGSMRDSRAKVEAAATVTVADFGDRFLREVVTKDRKNLTIPRRYFEKAIVPLIGDKAIREVTTEDVRQVIWRKKDEGFDAAAGEIRGVLKRMFDFALTCGLVTLNPVLALPMRHVHKAKSRERALSPDEVRIFLKAAMESNIRRQFKLGLQLILMTMVRKSELLLARWEHVDFENAEWQIPVENSKTGKPHIVYLSRQAVALFKDLQLLAAGSELVLPGRGSLTKPFAHNAINTALKTALAGQPIPAFTIHDLRRTASTLLHENGWPSDVVEKALNHTVGGVRGVYNRAEYAPQRREMLQFWADFIEQLMTGGGRVVRGRFRQVA